jgi:phosphoglycerate dehydrogenase-like enzyme
MSAPEQSPRVLICDKIAQIGVEMLADFASVDVKTGLSSDELQSIIGDYDAVVVRSATKIRADVIDRASRLKVIGRAGAGLDNIDVVAATEHDIKVVNAPDANTRAVAEHTLALMLSLARRVPRADMSMKEGRWEKSKLMGMSLAGKTLGIVGFGRIGREVAIRAQAFGMKVIVNQRRPTPELNLEARVEAVDLNDLLKQSDFVSLHVPARPETEGMIDLQKLALMKPSGFIINTARGSVVDEADLLEALDKGLISGAGLDVFAQEPAINSQLAQHDRVIATPHIAASTEDAQMDAAVTVVRQIIDVLKGARAQVKNPLGLEIVALDRVLPHEHVDPRRVERLVNRLREDQVLSSPPVVVELDDHYVVLDGASRVTALRELDYPHILVQIVSPQAGLSLHTWYHAIRKIELAALLDRFNSLNEIGLVETSPGKVLDEMLEYGGLCYLHTIDGRVFLVQAAAGVNHLQALNMIADVYLSAGHVSRTLHTDPEILRQEFPDLTALVVFPEYTVEQVLQIARAGRVLPAGITRFIVPGRALRINVDLARLSADESLSEKNRWLYDDIVQKFSNSRVRYYQEPVYLLDE